MSSKMPRMTMTTAPSSMPRSWVVRGRKSSTLRMKPKKMASPILGDGVVMHPAAVPGTSTAPILKARERTTGVAIRATTAATQQGGGHRAHHLKEISVGTFMGKPLLQN